MIRRTLFTAICLTGVLAFVHASPAAKKIVIGSKNFPESKLLAEILAQACKANGFDVETRLGLGGTLVCFRALENGEIDLYPEYTGTISQAIFNLQEKISIDSLRVLLKTRHDLDLLPSFGFNNTYAITLLQSRAEALGIRTISDLRAHPDLRLAFSLEFLNRADGWVGLQKAYNLPQQPRGMEHGLAYRAIQNGEIDVTDAYSTDGDIPRYHLTMLQDDRAFFPDYMAAPLCRSDLPQAARAVLRRLSGTIDEARMQQLNARVVVDGRSSAEVAAEFLAEIDFAPGGDQPETAGMWDLMLQRTIRHIELTVIALTFSILLALPLGIYIYKRPRLAGPVIYIAGLLQTIPSLALLGFMIPLLGIGPVPAIVALFLYALLPILRNTAIGLFSVDPLLKHISQGMGMTGWQQLRLVELPLAAPTILAGIKTAAIINIGTATLAAYIGAGGLGEPIFTGITLNNSGLILQGAIPAALLAVLAEFLFELVERFFIPPHLRQKGGA